MRATEAIAEHVTNLARSGAARPTCRQHAWSLQQALTAAALFRLYHQIPEPEQVASTEPAALAAEVAKVQVGELLDPAFTAWFLPWAATGILAANSDAGRSTASARARAVALRALARELGQEQVEHTHEVPLPRPPTPVTAKVLNAAVHLIAERPSPNLARTRLGALLVVMLSYPARPWQLCELTTEDVRVDAESKRLELAGPDGWARLSPSGSQLMADWLQVREQLVNALTGAAPKQLWVAVRSHHADGRVRPAGLPLHPRGLERSYVTHVRNLNVELASGVHSPLPAGRGGAPAPRLPLSWELLRRSIHHPDQPP
jgi:integrase